MSWFATKLEQWFGIYPKVGSTFEPPPIPPEGWGWGSYQLDWDLMSYFYATMDQQGCVMSHEYPPFRDEYMHTWKCVGRSVPVDQMDPTGLDWRQCALSSPIAMEFALDANGYTVRVWPEWMAQVEVW